MSLDRRIVSVALAIATFLLALSPASATDLDLTIPGFGWISTSFSWETLGGRSIYFRADETVQISQIEWFAQVDPGDYEAVIWAGTGENDPLGAQLALSSAALSGGVFDWQAIPLSVTLEAGNEYVLNFRRADGFTDFASRFQRSFWGDDPGEDHDFGPITLLDGRGGYAPDIDDNFWITHFRMTIVPEPSTLTLVGMGLLIVGARQSRRETSRCS